MDTDRTMTIGHTGNSIVMSITSNAVKELNGGTSETNLFNMLDSAISALKEPQKRRRDDALRRKPRFLRQWIKPAVV
ncbi:hypothetical protein WDV93_14845 [Pantoea ananatis]